MNPSRSRITRFEHPDTVSGTTVIPDCFGKPVRFHWTEGYSDVVVEYLPYSSGFSSALIPTRARFSAARS